MALIEAVNFQFEFSYRVTIIYVVMQHHYYMVRYCKRSSLLKNLYRFSNLLMLL